MPWSRGASCVEVGADVGSVGRALFGLSLGELAERAGTSEPVFRGVFQAVW
jgi:hypothetical protein